MADLGKLRCSARPTRERLIWAVTCQACDAATANSFQLGTVTNGSKRSFRGCLHQLHAVMRRPFTLSNHRQIG